MPAKMSDQEDLEYCIMFPLFPPSPKDPTLTSSSTTNRQDHKEEFVFVYEEDKRPLVVLLGWAGCQDRYLAKYSAIYEEKSCITLRYTAPVECLFGRRDKMPYIGKRLLQVISENSLNDHPIFFHVFSNGGALLYQHISLAMQQTNSPIQSQVKGVIFDSAPGERRVTSLFKAVSAIIGGHPLTNIPMSFFITVFLSMFWFFEVIAHALGRGFTIQSNPFALMEESYSWPQLFLYSNTDTLIPAADVEKFASRRAERGVRVQLVLFTNSPHVKHYTTYRDIYVNTVCSFINECLQSGNPSRRYEKSQDHGDSQSELDVFDTQPGLTKRVVLPNEATKSQNREEKTRLEGLSYFVQNIEQKVQPKEFDEESTKIESKADFKVKPVSNSFSARKKSRKLNPTQKAIVRARPLFVKKGDKVIFNFQHFASPEKVLKEYVRVNIYNKNRLARIDKKKISEALYSLHDVQSSSDVHSQDLKSKNRSKYENDEKRTSARRRSKVKQNINTENARCRTKLTRPWQPMKRIPATNNFVYEFNPFGNVEGDDTSKGPKDSQNLLNLCGSIHCSKGSANSKSTTNIKKDVARVKTRSSATLPKLHSNPDCTVNAFERKVINVEGETSLPSIPKRRDSTKGEVTFKEPENKCKTTPKKLNEIDREVDNVKSNWQQYRKSHASNPRSRKLYDMLEKATREIDKIQKNIDLTGNRYLRKSVAKLTKDSEANAERDVERIRDVLFPRRDSWTNSKSTSTIGASSPRKDLEEETFKRGKKEMLKQRSLFTEKRLWNIDDVFDLESNILVNRNEKNERSNEIMFAEASVLKEKKSSKIKSGDVGKYLEDYIANVDKFDMVARNKVRPREKFQPSPEYVADTLAKLNLKAMESQNAIEKNNDDDSKYQCCVSDDVIRPHFKEGGGPVDTSTSPCFSPIKNTESLKDINTKSVEISNESNAKFSGENAYVDTGFGGLNIPKDVLDQVLQSEYLKKDLLSLHPI
ncbi:hypothetical protein KPH14_004251 [Odynerus spinipes]|uniref:Transmembrane protein 53 n=1 Tax=Odynerus spinipes TaxID=1348599 RepID=A0AAD9RZT5_9HYME|nr:hypothetical protein KPH14_004251 [Odynerus spinipes]